jgi:hypothetical protein
VGDRHTVHSTPIGLIDSIRYGGVTLFVLKTGQHNLPWISTVKSSR